MRLSVPGCLTNTTHRPGPQLMPFGGQMLSLFSPALLILTNFMALQPTQSQSQLRSRASVIAACMSPSIMSVCSFGVFGIIPLWIARRWIRELSRLEPPVRPAQAA